MPKPPKAKISHKYFEDQFDDEKVLFVFRKHPIVMRKGFIFSSIATLVGPVYTIILTVVYAENPDKYPDMGFFFLSLLLSFLLAVILFFPSWIGWHYSVFIVTDQRFIQITQKGLFHRAVVDIGLPQIQMVNYEVAGFQETLLGFGTIMMQTYMGDLIIHDIHHPAKIQKKLMGILREEGVTSSQFPLNSSELTKEDEDEDEDEAKD